MNVTGWDERIWNTAGKWYIDVICVTETQLGERMEPLSEAYSMISRGRNKQ